MCTILTLCTEMSLKIVMVYPCYSLAMTTITSSNTTHIDVDESLGPVYYLKSLLNRYVFYD
jgi:hypothetical protein